MYAESMLSIHNSPSLSPLCNKQEHLTILYLHTNKHTSSGSENVDRLLVRVTVTNSMETFEFTFEFTW